MTTGWTVDQLSSIADALETGGVEAMKYEVQKNKPFNSDDVSRLMLYIIGCSDQSWPGVLVELGGDVNYRNDEGESVLSVCVHRWVETRVKDLAQGRRNIWINALQFLRLGCDPNSAYMSHSSVTGLAVSWDCPELATLFTLCGVDLDREEEVGVPQTLRRKMIEDPQLWPKELVILSDNLRCSFSKA
jgi:hypothetical protein